jgi:methionyl-tRNA formyltransferase
LNREDGRINWAEPAEIIERKIRAFNPWPGAFTIIADPSNKPRNLKIFSASIVDLSGKPGEIMPADDNGLVFATGNKALALGEVQLEGKQRMSADEFVRGHRRIAKL